eukprot:TRINITY_DN20459_c0_g1_i1.p1 TRINITY_DN20459_c0_g1~~TRINITY_DN20459_c0_g1_i1.p1  ORF type:complete len:763 (+),score=162.92 TRINITY_DN20459_c0_g1_i1:49-2289(+)
MTVKIEEHVSKSFNAKLTCNLKVPFHKAVALEGPPRGVRREAIKDGLELGRKFLAEGENGAKSALIRIRKRKWTQEELKDVDEDKLHVNYPVPGLTVAEVQQARERLVPPGEGWTRHREDTLVHSQSGVYFVQTGPKAGKYVKPGSGKDEWTEIDAPHTPVEHDIRVSSASASTIRKGAKLDRAVILSDIGKIARLALKMPLSFVDRPANAYALFHGLRTAEAAQWCAENFHKKLLPRLAARIHNHETKHLEAALEATLKELDSELLGSSTAFSGCAAIVALLLGNRFIVAGVGHVRAVVLPEKGSPQRLIDCPGSLGSPDEQDRIQKAGGVISNSLLHRTVQGDVHIAERINAAANVFDVILPDAAESQFDEKQVKTAYRKLALKVHPDKQAESADKQTFKNAFSKLENAREALETMLSHDQPSCKELCRVLRSEVHTRAGAASLLGVDKSTIADAEDAVVKDAEKAAKALLRKFEKIQAVAPDYNQAASICDEAVATIKRVCTQEALPRIEAQLREPVSMSRSLGLRDLRSPRPMVVMEPQTASFTCPVGAKTRFALLCGSTASLSDEDLLKAASSHQKRPKASALQWSAGADSNSNCSTSVCICVSPNKIEAAPAAKRARTSQNQNADTVRVRHILIRHQQLKQPDPGARREGSFRSAQEAEEAALKALESLIKAPGQFPRLCRELSDCHTGDQPGQLCGDLGWLTKGGQEAVIDEAVFALGVEEFSDVLTGARGLHIVQRLA